MKIVFDTNVLIAEALGSKRVESMIAACGAAKYRFVCSRYIGDELERVLLEKLSKTRRLGKVAGIRAAQRSELVDLPSSKRSVPGDESDDAILQTAISGGADFLITDDQHMLVLNPYETIKIVSIASFIQILKADGLL